MLQCFSTYEVEFDSLVKKKPMSLDMQLDMDSVDKSVCMCKVAAST